MVGPFIAFFRAHGAFAAVMLLSTTLDSLLPGVMPFWGEGRGAIKLTTIDHPPRRFAGDSRPSSVCRRCVGALQPQPIGPTINCRASQSFRPLRLLPSPLPGATGS